MCSEERVKVNGVSFLLVTMLVPVLPSGRQDTSGTTVQYTFVMPMTTFNLNRQLAHGLADGCAKNACEMLHKNNYLLFCSLGVSEYAS